MKTSELSVERSGMTAVVIIVILLSMSWLILKHALLFNSSEGFFKVKMQDPTANNYLTGDITFSIAAEPKVDALVYAVALGAQRRLWHHLFSPRQLFTLSPTCLFSV